MRLPRLRSSPGFFHPNTNRRMYRFASSGERGEPCGIPRLLLALKEETYLPEPIRRVFIPHRRKFLRVGAAKDEWFRHVWVGWAVRLVTMIPFCGCRGGMQCGLMANNQEVEQDCPAKP